MELLISNDKEIYDITELINSITYTDKLNDGCSKLEFSFTGNDPRIENSNEVRFNYEDIGFYGFVFKHGMNSKKEITVTAYDQLRYCKAKDTIVSKGETATTLTKKMCNYLNLNVGYLANTGYVLSTAPHDDKTWLDIIYSAINETLTNKGKWYTLRDEYGEVAIRDLEDLKLDLVLGDESLCYAYEYSKSIDDNFYNQIKLAMDNESTGKREIYIARDSNSIAKYGLLQYFEVLDKNGNPSQAKSKADMLLKLYNQETESLTLECLGDPRVRAGSSFYAQIEDIKLEKRLIVQSVTHKFIPLHTMQIEVVM